MPPRRNIVKVIDERQDKRSKREKPKEGKVLNVGPTLAYVQLVGSATPVPCAYDPQSGVAAGKRVAVQWIQNARKYVITGVYGTASGGISASDQAAANFELSPPSNFIADDGLPSSIVVTWDAPPQQDVTFELQQNTTPDEAGAVTPPGGITRGAMLIVQTDIPLYFRIRSISQDFRYSAWSDWQTSAPGPSAAPQGWLAQERRVTSERTTPDGMFTLIIGALNIQPGGSVEVLGDGVIYTVPESEYL
jgi:hypothetical protein